MKVVETLVLFTKILCVDIEPGESLCNCVDCCRTKNVNLPDTFSLNLFINKFIYIPIVYLKYSHLIIIILKCYIKFFSNHDINFLITIIIILICYYHYITSVIHVHT